MLGCLRGFAFSLITLLALVFEDEDGGGCDDVENGGNDFLFHGSLLCYFLELQAKYT